MAGLATAPLFAFAETLVLDFPLDCTLGETCHIQQFVDRDAGPGARDFTCGTLSYDGHKGTDFALPTLDAMRAGVDVVAMAPGVVTGTRDAMPDQYYTEATRDQVDGRDCGNGVVLRHPGGYETQYCHLKRDSVTVATGDQVDAGQVLGQVGLSGRTQFPHLHVSVRRDGAVIDPFAPDSTLDTCGDAPSETLWSDTPAYVAGGVLDVGFSDQVPAYDAIKDGSADVALDRTSPAMVFFGYLFGSKAGDQFRIQIAGPDGPVIDTTDTLDRTQAQLFRAAGKRSPRGGWRAGTYTGTFTLIRAGAPISSQSETITLPR